MPGKIERSRSGHPIAKKAAAGLILVAAAALVIHLVIGLIVTVFIVVLVAAVIAAVIWAATTIL